MGFLWHLFVACQQRTNDYNVDLCQKYTSSRRYLPTTSVCRLTASAPIRFAAGYIDIYVHLHTVNSADLIARSKVVPAALLKVQWSQPAYISNVNVYIFSCPVQLCNTCWLGQ